MTRQQVIAVRDVLADEFGWGVMTSAIFELEMHEALKVGHDVEFTCDDPLSARFRLKARPLAGEMHLRMAYHGLGHHDHHTPGEARAREVTARIAAALEAHR